MATLPRDGNGVPLQGLPPDLVPAKVTYDATISSTTEITLQTGTKLVEVAAFTKAVLLRWGAGDASAATDGFDVVIPADTVRRFAVPNGTSALNVIEQSASAAVSVSEYV